MGRLEKLKRQIIEEANIRILTENKPKEGDYRKEKNKEKKVRILVEPDEEGNPITIEQQQFKDVRYGYDNLNREVVKARKDSEFDKNLGLDDMSITYYCTKDIIRYDEPTQFVDRQLQEKSDKQWLGRFCPQITWKSKVSYK